MVRWLLAGCAGLALIGASMSADAAELLFTYSESGAGGFDFSFDQSSTPTPIISYSGEEADVPVSNWTSNFGYPASDIQWYSTSYGGGFNTETGPDHANTLGPQVYTGPESAPVFTPGTFDFSDDQSDLFGVLTI
ncbi:MAG: hypothetical protein ACREB9_09245, partial [Thermoplasmata archaeon]